jgi:HD-like signal output (HDOD) protein/DNA-binding CsgD family transcriptional regulator
MLTTTTKQPPNRDHQDTGPAPASSGEHPVHEGHGRRLLRAFQALEAFPALAEHRDRLIAVLGDCNVKNAEIAAIVESDAALAVAVLRAANSQRRGKRVDTAAAAVEQLGPHAMQQLVDKVHTFDFFDRGGVWGSAPRCFRRHALGTQRAADRITAEIEYEHRDRLALASLIHDIGKLVLMYAYPGYPARVHAGARTPEQRIRHERNELAVDHALVGGVLARRWGLPGSLACAIERHHHQDADGDAAIVRLADVLAHYEQGTPVEPGELLRAARPIGLRHDALRRVMCDLSSASQRTRAIDPCPLSSRELAALRGLARGLVYKQIGQELDISPSTIRSHLHNAYKKLGAIDRAQAVLIATEAGWL